MDPQPGLNYRTTNRKDMADLVEISRSNWWENLRGHFPYVTEAHANPTGPVAVAWDVYTRFTAEVIDVIENDGETASNLVIHGFLDSVYNPTLPPRYFPKEWITDAYLKHPHDNSPQQIQFVAIVNVQSQHPEYSMLEKVRYVDSVLREWKKDAYALETVLSDPDANWLFNEAHSIRRLLFDHAHNLVAQNTECPICADPFEADPLSTKFPYKGPCNHIICHGCFGNWLTQVCYGQWDYNSKPWLSTIVDQTGGQWNHVTLYLAAEADAVFDELERRIVEFTRKPHGYSI
ncbi:hypothetical protein SLS60_000901 [Paraconiothyrium brasiliense]|uniref:RING-type domain-containing protein n=1 Tax=Paraconiothyrium brasiliense TaxID=300254 RepID=A0ABR3S908_9PLEO